MKLRLDRLFTLYLASPCLSLAPRREWSIPILMYHSIAATDESKLHPYYRTATSPDIFAAQLKCLQQQGYASCSLSEACQHLQDRTQTAKLVVITFDDGYRDFYRRAFPLLNQYGFSATVFLPTAYIADSPISFKGKDCLTWTEVRELKKHGILFGSHTVTHPQLHDLSAAAVSEEITNSKKTIEEKLGHGIDSFAYPYAFPQTDADFKKRLRETLRTAGYENGVCTTVGTANRTSDRFFMERLPVNSCDDATLLLAKLKGAYNWIAKTQYLAKKGKAYLRPSVPAKYRIPNDFPAVQQRPTTGS